MEKIRNFCIIAHIDHGKSTLADRMLEITGTVEKRKMKEQILDRMELEQERGITIKLQPVTMDHEYNPSIEDGSRIAREKYCLNLIDTPGHVDFTYEVSRSLAAVEGAILLVDATQGIQAQTLANLYLAMEQDLTIIPVINKIDLPAADIPKVKNEIINLIGCKKEEILAVSAKTGEGVKEVLDSVVKNIPAPSFSRHPYSDKEESSDKENEVRKEELRGLIFDSNYDEYKGVVAYIRVFNGELKKGDKISLLATKANSEALDVGVFKPDYYSTGGLKTGEIGYVITGFKDVSECKVGDTITILNNDKNKKEIKALPGYKEVKPMVFAGIFPKEGSDFKDLRDAMERLKLNDASLTYENEGSEALGLGFRCGFLGLLHLEIFQERLRREYGLDLIVTVPSVAYRVYKKTGSEVDEDEYENKFKIIRTPQKLPKQEEIEKIEEPWVSLDVISPKEFQGNVMDLVQNKRGIYKNTEYLDDSRAVLHYDIPMSAILTDFYDKVKSVSSGYASVNYEFKDYREADVVKMDILVAEDAIEALATIVYRDEAHSVGKKIVSVLKETLPKQMFVLKLQAAVGGKIIAAERLSAMRKDVTAKLYGGDVSRKRKLLEKQKKGKKKMMASGKGSVDIPADTFVKILRK
jgi:GTP-binding protein LepA